MKRIVVAVAVALAALLLVSGCGSEKPKLYVYNWIQYIPEDVVEDFEKRYNVRVIYDVFASNEEMYAKLKMGGGNYDLVFPSGDFTSIMIREGMVREIDKERVSAAFANLDQAVLARVGYDPEFKYSVPYAAGMAGVSINTAHVPGYVKSWRVFEDPRLNGRLTLLDDMREVMGAALKTLGYSVNSKNPDELEQAKQLVLEWKKNIVKFDAEAFGKGFAAGEFWATHGYAENVFVEIDEKLRETAEFFIPVEGGPMYVDNMMILKNAKNVDLAYQFINYLHEPEIYARIMDYLETPSINVPARKHMVIKPQYEIDDLMGSDLNEFKEDLGEHLELYNKIWQEIRVGK